MSSFQVPNLAAICPPSTKRVAPVMKAQGSGTIINIAAVGGRVQQRGLVVYCASKSGVIGFTRNLAHEIKNPLGGIRGAAELLAMELQDGSPELTEYTQVIVHEVDRLPVLGRDREHLVEHRPAVAGLAAGRRREQHADRAAATDERGWQSFWREAGFTPYELPASARDAAHRETQFLMTARTLEFFEKYDLLLAPATIVAPFPVAKRTCEYFASVGLGAGRPLAAR